MTTSFSLKHFLSLEIIHCPLPQCPLMLSPHFPNSTCWHIPGLSTFWISYLLYLLPFPRWYHSFSWFKYINDHHLNFIFSVFLSPWIPDWDAHLTLPFRCLIDLKFSIHPWVGKIPWRIWLSTPVFLPGKSHGQRSLMGDSLWGCKELDMMNDWTHTHTHTHIFWPCSVACRILAPWSEIEYGVLTPEPPRKFLDLKFFNITKINL